MSCWVVLLGSVFPRIPFFVWFWVELTQTWTCLRFRDCVPLTVAGRGGERIYRHASRFQLALILPHSWSSCPLPALPTAATPGLPASAVRTHRGSSHEEPADWTWPGSRFPCKPWLVSDFSLILQLPFPDPYLPSSSPNCLKYIFCDQFLIP